MKKIFSVVLASLVTLSMLLQLTACSMESNNTNLKMGQWLALIADSFGMSGYMDSTPYFKSVPASDTYFDDFQMAAEWEVLTPNETTDSNTVVTWKDALVTLVNAGEFIDLAVSDDEKIKYGIENFDSSIRDYRIEKPIPEENAVMLLATAQNQWSKKTYDTSMESHSYKEGVQDFTDFPDVMVSEDGNDYIIPNMSIDNLPAPSGNYAGGSYGNDILGNNGDFSFDEPFFENPSAGNENIGNNNGSVSGDVAAGTPSAGNGIIGNNGNSVYDDAAVENPSADNETIGNNNDSASGDVAVENPSAGNGTVGNNGNSVSDDIAVDNPSVGNEPGSDDSAINNAVLAKPGTSDPTTLKPGDLVVVPAPDNKLDKEYCKVESIEVKDGETVVHTSEEDVELEDVYQELHIQGTVVPTAENTIIRGPDGSILNPETAEALKLTRYDGDKPQYADMLYRPDQSPKILNCAKDISDEFKIGDDKIKFKATLDNNSVGISATIETGNCLETNDKSNKDKYGKLKGSVSLGLDKISITQNFDWGFFKLRSAMLRVDAQTSESIKLAYSKEFNGYIAPDDNRNSSFSSNFKRSFKDVRTLIRGEKKGKGAKTIASRKVIKIASLDVYNVGVAKLCLDINLQFKADGSIGVTCTQSNSVGVEYKDGNIRFIKEHSEKAEATAKGSIEANCGIGPALYAFGLKKKLLGLEVRPGLRAEVSATLRLADEENHLLQVCDDLNDVATPEEMDNVIKSTSLTATHQEIEEIAASQGRVYKSTIDESSVHCDSCIDIQVSFVLNAGLSADSCLTDLVGDKFNEAVNLKVPLFKRHVDNGDWANASQKCRLQYKPFDLEDGDSSTASDSSESSESNAENTSITMGETLHLSTMNVNIAVDGEKQVEIEQLPYGYSVDDVLFVSKNGKVATVDTNGNIKAVSEGSTIIYAQTRDGKFSAMVAVIVEGDYNTEFNSLEV